MKVLGIEFDSSDLHYVLVEQTNNGFEIRQANRLRLSETRSREALVAFQDAVKTLFNSTMPNFIGVKAKPEKGGMRAGAASLKMEGIVLANAPSEVEFISGAQINKCNAFDSSMYAYLIPALKVAVVTLNRHLEK